MIRLDEFEERKDSSSFNDFQRFLLPIFKDFSKTYKSNQLSKNCKCKQHFHPIISPVKDLHSNLKTFKDFKDRYEPETDASSVKTNNL
jgi:hypothetical protein